MDLNLPQFLSGVGCGICLSLSVIAFRNFGTLSTTAKAIKKFVSRSEYKLVLVVRSDLNMTKGKIASQCGHAAVAAYENSQKYDPETLKIWRHTGQAKIALKTDSLEEMNKIAKNAKEMDLIISPIRDDGRTQVAQNTMTVLGIGPAPKDIIDKVTGHLKLL